MAPIVLLFGVVPTQSERAPAAVLELDVDGERRKEFPHFCFFRRVPSCDETVQYSQWKISRVEQHHLVVSNGIDGDGACDLLRIDRLWAAR